MAPTGKAIQIIHTIKSNLTLSDDVYRDILFGRYKKTSSLQLSQRQADDLIKHFRSLQLKAAKYKPRYDDKRMRKIEVMWKGLYDAGVVINPSHQALQAFVKGRTGVANIKWCDTKQLSMLIEILKAMAKREGVNVK